jgi:hypothetical protein
VRTTKRTKLTQPDWKAFAWLAERTRPNDYGNRVKTVTVEEGTGSDTQEVTSWADLVRIAREGIEQGK